jgi:cytochrome c biogenesis protein CcdA
LHPINKKYFIYYIIATILLIFGGSGIFLGILVSADHQTNGYLLIAGGVVMIIIGIVLFRKGNDNFKSAMTEKMNFPLKLRILAKPIFQPIGK